MIKVIVILIAGVVAAVVIALFVGIIIGSVASSVSRQGQVPVQQPPSSSAPVVPSASASPSPSPTGLANVPSYPVGGPAADITQTGCCTLTEQGDPSVGNRYYNVSTTLVVDAPGQITIYTVDIQVLGADGSEIGSLQVMPVSAFSSTVSAPLVVTSGTVPFSGVADQVVLSGQFGPSCRIVSISYDDGNTAP